MTGQTNNNILEVRILSPKQTFFSGPAESVSSKNFQGPFDILPGHAKFITIIEKTPIIVRTPDGKKPEFNFPLAIIFNTDNKVTIFTDIQLNLEQK